MDDMIEASYSGVRGVRAQAWQGLTVDARMHMLGSTDLRPHSAPACVPVHWLQKAWYDVLHRGF